MFAHAAQRSETSSPFDPRRHERFATVRKHDDVAGLEVERWVLEESEIVAVVGVKAVRRRRRVGVSG